MRFDKSKKRAIIQYLLEKMEENTPNVVKLVSETFEINPNTVHSYIKELEAEKVIMRVKRGTYQLLSQTSEYVLCRSEGQLEDEQLIYDRMLSRHFADFFANVRDIWSYILGEIINNVIDHSEAETLTIRVDQNHLATRIRISDDGIGIFQKIKEHFGFYSLDDAICELFKGKLTTDPENHSGEGIFFSSKLADRFSILSDGKEFSNDKYEWGDLRDAAQEKRGTSVFIELANTSNKIPGEIFSRFAQVDGGFTITTIPLKNIFEAAPVSRSQAKRVCMRLDKFQKVILDFQGLTWMGQGFAHQIFVVFQKQHPEITFEPINMSDGVAQMYAHVTGREYE